MVQGRKIVWTAEALALLGTVPDRVVAEKLGCCISIVNRKRVDMGIDSTRFGSIRNATQPTPEQRRDNFLKKARERHRRKHGWSALREMVRAKASADAEWVRGQLAAGRTQADIARDLGVTRQRVQQMSRHFPKEVRDV